MECDREITWVKTKNAVDERLIESSFIHRLVPRKLSRKRKLLNAVFEKTSGLISYSQYVQKRTMALQDLSDDSQTEDDILSDCDYSRLCKSYRSFNDRQVQGIREDSYVSKQQVTNKSRLSEKSKIKKEKEIMTKNPSEIKEEKNNLRSTIINCTNVTQNNTLTAQTGCTNDDTCISISSLETKEELKDYNSSLKSEEEQWHSLHDQTVQEIPITKKVRLRDSIERNLVTELKTETSDVHKCDTNDLDIDGNISSDFHNMWNESPNFLRQSTPVHENAMLRTDSKLHKLISKKDLKNYPQDSGIDEDSQEDSSREGKNNAKKLPNQLPERNKISKASEADILHRSIKETVEKETNKSCTNRKSTISSQCLENTNRNSLQTCRTDYKVKEENPNQTRSKSAKLNLNRVFENESMTNQFNTKEIISPDFKSTECQQQNEITEEFARNKNKKLKHEEQKVTHVYNDVADNTKPNISVSERDKNILDTENTSENIMYNSDQIQMEDCTCADSESNECTQMTSKSIKKEGVNIEHNKNMSMLLNNDLSESTDCKTSCVSLTENKQHTNNCKEHKLPAFVNNDVIKKDTVEGTQRQKLVPKVMCTEVVNKKYKIILKDKYNIKRNNVKKILHSSVDTLNESTITSYDEEEKNSTIDADNNYNSGDKNSLNKERTYASQEKPETEEGLVNFEDQEDIENNIGEKVKEMEEENVQEQEKQNDEESSDFENVNSINKLYPQIEVSQKGENSRNVFDEQDDEQEYKNITNITSVFSDSLEKIFQEDEDEDEDEKSNDNENDIVLPRSIRRLQQLKRLNLTVSSDTSSEDEVELKNTIHEDTSKTRNDSQEKQETVMTQKMNKDTKDEKYFCKAIKQNTNLLQCRKYNDNDVQKTNTSESLRHKQQSIINQEEITKDTDTMDDESTEEEVNSVSNEGRPTTLEELIIQQKLVKNRTPATFNLKNIQDEDEIYILNIPNALNVHDLKGKKMMLKKDKLKLGNEMYKIKYRKSGSVTCVFHKGKKHTSYKVVNKRPAGSISTRYKHFDLPDSLNTEESTEDDAFVTVNSFKEKEI